MSAIEQQIDELYTLPLSDFTAARNALAKSLKGDDGARIKRLEKPSVVAWAVNQLYWVERRTFDRLLAAGRAVRAAQIAALKGKAADLREATAAHRQAVSDAAAAALRIIQAAPSKPSSDVLGRMLEALSLAQELPSPPGRFTEAAQPAGFEALAGISPVARAIAPPVGKTPLPKPAAARPHEPPVDPAAERRRQQAEAAARKAAEAAHADARRALERARGDEQRASARADSLRKQLEQAETVVTESRERVKAAEADVARAAALAKL